MDFAAITNCSQKKKKKRGRENTHRGPSQPRRADPIMKCLPSADDITSVNDRHNDGSHSTQLIYNTPTVRHRCEEPPWHAHTHTHTRGEDSTETQRQHGNTTTTANQSTVCTLD